MDSSHGGSPFDLKPLVGAVVGVLNGVPVHAANGPSPIIRVNTDTLSVQRGRDKCAAMRDAVQELRARGHDPVQILVSADTAADMHSFVAWFAKSYDGVLPPIAGVPVVEAMLGGQDASIQCAVAPGPGPLIA